MAKLQKLIVIGAGGFGSEVAWAAENCNARSPKFEIVGFADDNPAKIGGTYYGYPVLGSLEDMDRKFDEKPGFLCAIGNNRHRVRVVERALRLGWSPVTVIDPSVIVGKVAKVGLGTYVGAGTIISIHSSVGDHVIINHCCSIGHDSKLEDFVQVSPGGRVSGACVLKRGATMASNAALAPRVVVGEFATVGACSFAVCNVPAGATVVGSPARTMLRAGDRPPSR
jgi:sugar O-acyltransferase (sialic acid O-acetyltransferase NeuD family)